MDHLLRLPLARGDLMYSETHHAFVRFLRWEADCWGLCWAVVGDRGGAELPDLVHPAFLYPPDAAMYARLNEQPARN